MGDKFIVSQKNYLYQRALKREIGIWQNTRQEDFLSEQFHKVDFKFNGSDFSLSTNLDWIKFFSQFGPFENALILGGNNTNFEGYLKTNKIVQNIENIDIVFRDKNNEAFRKFNDLNFVELAEGKFDLIIAKSILHHIVNLEHLVTQVNKALTMNGLFVVFEYVGENKQQWDDNKISIINREFECEALLPGYRFNKLEHNYYNGWPFESIRSQEIEGVINETFNERIIELKWGRLNWPLDYHISQYCFFKKIILDNDKLEKLKKLSNDLDKKHAQEGSLKPSYLFGVYKKSKNPKDLKIHKWHKNKIRKEFVLRGSLTYRIKSLLLTYSNSNFVRFIFKIRKLLK